MDFGVAMFSTHDGMDPGSAARLVEEHGFESLFFPEHTHIPADRLTPSPAGEPLPRRYAHTYDLFVAMTAAAIATTKLRIGLPSAPRARVEASLEAFGAAVAELHGE